MASTTIRGYVVIISANSFGLDSVLRILDVLIYLILVRLGPVCCVDKEFGADDQQCHGTLKQGLQPWLGREGVSEWELRGIRIVDQALRLGRQDGLNHPEPMATPCSCQPHWLL